MEQLQLSLEESTYHHAQEDSDYDGPVNKNDTARQRGDDPVAQSSSF
jgi:hypothetical protein